MASFTDKTPPPFDRNIDDYTKWRKKLELWENITDVAATKKGSLIVLRLDEDTQDTVLEAVSNNDLKSEQGAEKILEQLDNIFQVDPSVAAYKAFEEFISYQRPKHLSIKEHCLEFQKRLGKVQSSGSTLGDHVLAYRLMKSANLSEGDERLMIATTEKMTYDSMTKQLKKVFSSDSRYKSEGRSNMRIKGQSVECVQDTFCGMKTYYHCNTQLCDTSYRRGYNEEYDYRTDEHSNISNKGEMTDVQQRYSSDLHSRDLFTYHADRQLSTLACDTEDEGADISTVKYFMYKDIGDDETDQLSAMLDGEDDHSDSSDKDLGYNETRELSVKLDGRGNHNDSTDTEGKDYAECGKEIITLPDLPSKEYLKGKDPLSSQFTLTTERYMNLESPVIFEHKKEHLPTVTKYGDQQILVAQGKINPGQIHLWKRKKNSVRGSDSESKYSWKESTFGKERIGCERKLRLESRQTKCWRSVRRKVKRSCYHINHSTRETHCATSDCLRYVSSECKWKGPVTIIRRNNKEVLEKQTNCGWKKRKKRHKRVRYRMSEAFASRFTLTNRYPSSQ